ncbi:two-component system sensor histidine kinase NtrB [Roseicitreum antarcticum]|uniref:histidine kinase n=1 Tax=Roseicitreum antarcticum TaxID=564137 RepID=A0A1H3C4L5_9RHOB|nr:ATP-binding protein [Roseicitreum antarcticum]SDX49122.1 two-component system, NtrC family, nitrogen regulation sensor histidine kinase GlnL [Roseicitreum antarcticum]
MKRPPLTGPVTGVIWASLPVPTVLLAPDDNGIEVFTDCNPAAEQFLSASRRSLMSTPAFDRLMIDAAIELALDRARANRAAIFINDVLVGTGDRAPIICNLQLAPLGDDPNIVMMLIAPREIAGRLGRAEAVKSAAKSAIGMADMLAHEIKNPLAGIAGAAQLLSMGLKAEDLELTDLIVEETRRIVKLLEQVEQFGNQRPPECRAVNLHDILERARRSVMVGFAAHMSVSEAYDPSLPLTWGDPDQLQQVFLNLLKNASEAQPGGGRIRIKTFFEQSLRVRGPDGQGVALPLHVEIIDDGPGLPPSIAADIFDPFISGRENGTGLGLALVSKIIADHGGWIAVDSAPGRTVFRVSLPMAPKDKTDEK